MPASQSVLDLWAVLSPSSKANAKIARAQLDPRYRYLHVQTGKSTALLVLGYVDPHPQGVIEVWFSHDKGVLRLQNGRLVGIRGAGEDWLDARFEALPEWASLASGAQVTRTRDVQPDYRFNIRETLQIRAIPAPRNTRLQGGSPEKLVWYEECCTGSPALPPARYGLQANAHGVMQVVYGEQPLTPDLTVSWQTWPPQ